MPSLRLQLRPGVLERERPVEDERTGRRVGVRAEVAEPLELHGLADRQVGERRLDEAARAARSRSRGSGPRRGRGRRRRGTGSRRGGRRAGPRRARRGRPTPSAASPWGGGRRERRRRACPGRSVQRSSTTLPSASLTTSLQVTKYAERSRTSRPGARRKNFFGGSSMKSSRSIQSSRVKGTLRLPADGSSGLLGTSISSTCPSG